MKKTDMKHCRSCACRFTPNCNTANAEIFSAKFSLVVTLGTPLVSSKQMYVSLHPAKSSALEHHELCELYFTEITVLDPITPSSNSRHFL